MAKEHPRYASFEWPEYEYREYPRMIYPGAPDPLVAAYYKTGKRKGKPIDGVIVNSDEELAAALGIDPPEPEPASAPAPKRGAPKKVATGSPGVSRLSNAADEREALIAEAEQLGVQIDKSWSDVRIQDAIDTHKREEEVV